MRKFWKGTRQSGRVLFWKFWKDLLRPSFFRILRVFRILDKAFSYGSPD
jgi:hypothetical protein